MGTDTSMAETVEAPGDDTAVEMANGQDADAEASEVLEWDHDANIHLRLWRAANEIGQLEKDGTIKSGNKVLYEYITHDQVTLRAKSAFRRHGVMVIPTVDDCQQEGNRTDMVVKIVFASVDDPSDTITMSTIGYGVDSSDKGPGKAFSYAMKYAYLKILMLNSADDIEAEDTKFEPAVSQEALAKEKSGAADAVKAWADNFNAAIRGVTSLAELKEVRRNNRNMLLSPDVPQVTQDYFHDLLEKAEHDLAQDDI